MYGCESWKKAERSWWWTGRPGVLHFMGSQRVGHDWVTERNWIQDVLPYAIKKNLLLSLEKSEMFETETGNTLWWIVAVRHFLVTNLCSFIHLIKILMFKNEEICSEKLGHLAQKWWQTEVIWLKALCFTLSPFPAWPPNVLFLRLATWLYRSYLPLVTCFLCNTHYIACKKSI